MKFESSSPSKNDVFGPEQVGGAIITVPPMTPKKTRLTARFSLEALAYAWANCKRPATPTRCPAQSVTQAASWCAVMADSVQPKWPWPVL